MTRTILTRGIFLKEWDFPENDAWHVCEVGSTGGTVAFLTLVTTGWEDYYGILQPGQPLVWCVRQCAEGSCGAAGAGLSRRSRCA